jgi:hypothetical protein
VGHARREVDVIVCGKLEILADAVARHRDLAMEHKHEPGSDN